MPIATKSDDNAHRLPIVVADPQRYFFQYMHDAPLRAPVYGPYRKQGADYFLSRVKRKLRVFGHVPPLFDQWRRHLAQGSKVVVFDSAFDQQLLTRLKGHADQVYLYLWNPMAALDVVIPWLREYLPHFKVYSHDRHDCAQLGLHFNSTFYYRRPDALQHSAAATASDVVFVGADKDRAPILGSIHQQLDGLSLDFHIQSEKLAGKEIAPGLKAQSDYLAYGQYLDRVIASRAIFEMLQQGQHSLSLRPMESLFFQRKLITNFQEIRDEPLYHADNILIYDDPGELTASRVGEFLDKPWQQIDPDIVAYYEYDQWVRRFV